MEDELSTKDALEMVKTLAMMNEIFAKARRELFGMVDEIDNLDDPNKSAIAMFQMADRMTEQGRYDEDDYVGMLLVAIGTLVRIRRVIRGTALEKELREALNIPESQATPGTEAHAAQEE